MSTVKFCKDEDDVVVDNGWEPPEVWEGEVAAVVRSPDEEMVEEVSKLPKSRKLLMLSSTAPGPARKSKSEAEEKSKSRQEVEDEEVKASTETNSLKLQSMISPKLAANGLLMKL